METMDFSTLTEKQKSELLAYHLDIIRRLRATILRSDWHAAFEAALRILTDKYGEAIHLLVEEELGIEPPRADFIVLLHDPKVQLRESIFTHFKTVNILEYKNPKDDLNEKVLWKAIGYAGLYISDKGSDAKDVTITLFREKRNKEFFDRLASEGKLAETGVKGIYTVKGELETRIVLTGELEGPEYAAYRALSMEPAQEDFRALVKEGNKDRHIKAYVRVIVNHTIARHPELLEVVRREPDMNEALQEFFKDEIDKRALQALDNLIEKGRITVKEAADELGMTVQEFQEAVENLKVTA